MALTFKTSGGGGDFKTVPAGSHFAVCDLVVYLGLQPGSGMYPDPKHQLYVRFEVPSERVSYERDGKKFEGPVVIGQFFTASMHEKANLRKQLESWRGKKLTDEEAESFDVSTILGQSAMLMVVEKVKGDKVYANIQSIGNLPKGAAKLSAESPLILFDEDHKDSYESLPEWLRKRIDAQIKPQMSHATGTYATTQPEQGDPGPDGAYHQAYANQHGVEIDDSDIPF